MLKRVINKKIKPFDIEQEFRNLGALVEHVDDRVIAVAEQYGDIKKTLDGHTKKFDIHEDMIGNIATDLSIVKEDVASIKHSMKEKVNVDDFISLERRVIRVEKQIR